MADIEVKMGDVKVMQKSTDNLVALGIGSCLIITLYDKKNKIGALAHTILSAHSSKASDKAKDLRYIDTAIDEILTRMVSYGSKRENLEAKLIGGANMFSAFVSDIGKENVLCARQKLKKENIVIVGECTGGSQARSVEFSVATGIVTVKTKF